MEKKSDLIIAIDPDVDKSGVAFLIPSTRILETFKLTFPQLLEYLQSAKMISTEEDKSIMVLVEAGWKVQNSNYHNVNGRRGKRISKDVGRNQQVGILTVEMCKHWNIEVIEHMPLKKNWKGPDGKISHKELQYFTHIEGRTNQEERDAALLAWVYAGLPIKINNNVRILFTHQSGYR